MLQVINLHAAINNQQILKGIDLHVRAGEVHAIMGPNGSGKSTLAQVLAGREHYTVTSGDILFEGESLLEKSTEQRALAGLFLAFQYPVEIPGVNTAYFLRTALNTLKRERGEKEIKAIEFQEFLRSKMALVDMDESFIRRSVNEGFSGGEKKRSEILQMLVLEPKLAILDETDSGLDIDALKIVAEGVNRLRDNRNAFILVTHYQRLLNMIVPDVVHVLYQGRIVRTAGAELALELEKSGYDGIKSEFNSVVEART